MVMPHEIDTHRATFRWEQDDYNSLGRFIVNDTPIGDQLRRQQTFATVLMLAVVVALAAAWLPERWAVGLLALIFAVMFIPLRRRLARTAAQQMGKALRPLDPAFIGRNVDVTLLPEGLDLKTDWKSARYAWPAVHKITRDDDHLYILLVDRNTLVIPLRAFHGTPHFNAFYDQATQYHQQSRSSR